MIASVEIAGQEMLVEYVIKITSPSRAATGPSFYSGGEPAEPCEFELEVLGIDFPKRHADVAKPMMPDWLKSVLETHLYERDDVNEAVQEAEYENYDEG